MLYCPGKGQELLSALGVNLECHASSIFLVLKPPLSIIDALSKSSHAIDLFIILPVEGCSANIRKLVFLKVLARDRFFKFHKMFYPGCGPSIFSPRDIVWRFLIRPLSGTHKFALNLINLHA